MKSKILPFSILLFFFGLPAARAQVSSSTARHIVPTTALPSTCSVANGDVYYLRSGAAADQGCYECCSGLALCPSPPWRRCGNPVPASSGITGSGTAGTIPKFTTASNIGDSLLTYSAVSPEAWVLGGLTNTAGSGLYVGNGRTSATPMGSQIYATGGVGTNINGGHLQFYGGASTGSGTGGSIDFFVTPSGSSGSTVNNPIAAFYVAQTGEIGVGSPLTFYPPGSFFYNGYTSGTIKGTAQATNGQILIGSTAADPVASTITAGSGITVTNGAGSITIAASGGGGTAQIIEPASKFPVTTNLVFPNTFIGGGSGWKYFGDLGVADATTLNADATWALLYHLPPALPTGTAKLRLQCFSALSSGVLKFNPKWNVCAAGTDCSSVTLNAEGTQTLTYTVADAFVEVDTTLDASTVTAGTNLIMNLVFEDTGTTAAGNSTCSAFLVFIP